MKGREKGLIWKAVFLNSPIPVSVPGFSRMHMCVCVCVLSHDHSAPSITTSTTWECASGHTSRGRAAAHSMRATYNGAGRQSAFCNRIACPRKSRKAAASITIQCERKDPRQALGWKGEAEKYLPWREAACEHLSAKVGKSFQHHMG